jgi:hypothetical protein
MAAWRFHRRRLHGQAKRRIAERRGQMGGIGAAATHDDVVVGDALL